MNENQTLMCPTSAYGSSIQCPSICDTLNVMSRVRRELGYHEHLPKSSRFTSLPTSLHKSVYEFLKYVIFSHPTKTHTLSKSLFNRYGQFFVVGKGHWSLGGQYWSYFNLKKIFHLRRFTNDKYS